MREIKFRAWDKNHNTLTSPMQIRSLLRYIAHGATYNTELENPGDVENLILQQYTGLKDKNGKEIYEGDIIEFYRVPFVGDPLPPEEREVVAINEVTLLENLKLAAAVSDGEVIGNIYENKELLNERT